MATKHTRLNDPDLRRARALLIIEHRIRGNSIAETARHFGVHPNTIVNEIDYAKRNNLIQKFEDQCIEELVPVAIQAMRTALSNGDVDAAKEVLKGLGVFRKPSSKPLLKPEAEAPAEDSLEIYVKRISKGELDAQSQSRTVGSGATPRASLAPSPAPNIPSGDVLEGTVLDSTTAPPPVGARGDEGRLPDGEGPLELPDDPQGPAVQ